MFLAPLSEIPSIGRNIPYIVTLFIFVCLQIPLALCTSPGAIFTLRVRTRVPRRTSFAHHPLQFLAGFFGSPALATGGASIADLYSPRKRAYFIGIWGLSAVAGPALGPLVGGFAVQALGIPWATWPILFASGAALIWLIFLVRQNTVSERPSRC
jgi:DHA1 family multidrug resistance protein-like MFS transporter